MTVCVSPFQKERQQYRLGVGDSGFVVSRMHILYKTYSIFKKYRTWICSIIVLGKEIVAFHFNYMLVIQS